MSAYVFSQRWRQEGERLTSLELLLDPGTRRLLRELGARDGMRCLELGAGRGSIAAWLAHGRADVVAVDADARFLGHAAAAGAEVLEQDLVSAPLPGGGFDVAHARLLLVHLPSRDELLAAAWAALRPGGVLLVEDFDWGAVAVHPPAHVHARVVDGVLAFHRDVGVDPLFGRTLVGRLERAGFVDVAAEGRVACGPGGSPEIEAFRLTLEQLRPALVSGGYLTDGDVDDALALLEDDAHTFMAPTVMAAWGRRPAEALA